MPKCYGIITKDKEDHEDREDESKLFFAVFATS